ncbi:MAG: excinuclease ABC subunit UvrC [Thermoplasmata archaeon]|nr:excinuclease ABC subunit UvrC [Thermoplasmata archaeon]
MIDPSDLPSAPGVYIFKDGEGRALYVGKARDIRKRVASHINNPTIKDRRILSRAEGVDYIITRGEMEATLLEEKMIKDLKPPYNVALRDDKSYPYLLLTTEDEYPGLFLVRGLKRRKGKLFGPYSGVREVRTALRYLRFLFPVRNCWVFRKRSRPCMEESLGRCPGPCAKEVDIEEYRDVVRRLESFLSGNTEDVIKVLEEKMRDAANSLNFELAAYYRDVIRGVKKIVEGAKLSLPIRDFDLVEADEGGRAACLLRVREGRIVGGETFLLTDQLYSPEKAVEVFLEEFYQKTSHAPPIIYVSHPPEDIMEIKRYIEGVVGRAIKIMPAGRDVNEARALALQNLRSKLERVSRRLPRELSEEGIKELKKVLNLQVPPLRIEGVDISHFGGEEMVGSLVVFLDGRPAKSFYRRYKIKSVEGLNDPAAIKEVVKRRLKRLKEGEGAPDLLLVDGGKGQLTAAVDARDSLGLTKPPIIALAKREEIVFVEGKKKPLVLSRSSPALLLLMAVRDEAHRFAISHVRKEKGKVKSLLLSVKGIGNRRMERLMREFSSLEELSAASAREISLRAGIPLNVARELKKTLEGP